ncbi:MAG TPA: DUF6343 family protein [Aeromicrobium sp.]|nr:DUF6343 family protein [Aeromicrobium sp.]
MEWSTVQCGANSDRDGDEPIHARSPLRMRFAFAVGGAVFFAALAITAITMADNSGWIGDMGVLATIFAALDAVNAGIVWWRLHKD